METSINDIGQKEKELYTSYYLGDDQPLHGYPEGGYVMQMGMFVEKTVEKGSRILEIGFGHGRTARYLLSRGFDVTGVDITLAGFPGCDPSKFFEAPVWMLPFEDGCFDYTFSLDVLEHLPTELVGESIKEIYRVTEGKTFHAISTIYDVNYTEAHKTVKPITWWEGQFSRLNSKKADTHITDAQDFRRLLFMTKGEPDEKESQEEPSKTLSHQPK